MAQQQQQQQQAIRKFVLGSKELEDKTAEFLYDKGWYSITDIVGEERTLVYRSRNAQEAYMKWNVYIGRKKERPLDEHHRSRENADRDREQRGAKPRERRERRDKRDRREGRENHESREYRDFHENRERRDNREYLEGGARHERRKRRHM